MLALSARTKLQLRNIVVATDFSPASRVAFNHAIAIARHYDSHIILVHAIGLHLQTEPQPGAEIAVNDEMSVEAEQRLRSEAERCTDVECRPCLLKGTALEVVEQILALDHVDLIVVGTHGNRGFRRLLIGSAAEQIFRHVHCPVLAIGPSLREGKADWQPKRVLLVTDLESKEAATVEYAIALASKHNAELALLHVTSPAAAPYPEDTELLIGPYFRSRLQELLPSHPGLAHQPQVLVEFGHDPVAEIVRVAKLREIDLLLLSVHPREPWTTHFRHGAYRIVAEAPCPVLIVQRTF